MLIVGFIVKDQMNRGLVSSEVNVGVLTLSGVIGGATLSRNRWSTRISTEMGVQGYDEVTSAIGTLAGMRAALLSIRSRESILDIGFYEVPDFPSEENLDPSAESSQTEAVVLHASKHLYETAMAGGYPAAPQVRNIDTLVVDWMSVHYRRRTLDTLSAGARQTAEADHDLGVLSVDGPFVRPNNEEYKPRVIGGRHQDVALLRHLHANKMPVRLYGPAGSGKTAMVEAAFPDVITVLGNGDLTVSGLVGGLVPDGASWRWVDGPLTRAMKEGKVLFVDEILRIPNEVLAILLGAMDGRGILRLDDNPEAPMVHAEEGFGVIAAYNPDVTGGRQLDEAILSRFVVGIEVTTDFEVAAELGVPDKALIVARNLATMSAHDLEEGGYGNWVPQMRDLLAFRDVLPLGEEFAVGALLSACPNPEDLSVAAEVVQAVFGFEPTRLSAGGRA